MIMPREDLRLGDGARRPIAAHRVPRGAIAFARQANRVGIDRAIACPDGRIDLAPCCASCDRSCARSRRAMRALLAAIGLAGSADPRGE